MNPHVLLNDLRKSDKMRGLPTIFFATSLINSSLINTIIQEHECLILSLDIKVT